MRRAARHAHADDSDRQARDAAAHMTPITSPAVLSLQRRIVRAWRELSGGPRKKDNTRKSLIACSAGVDSSALALALASHVRSDLLVIAHVQHDLRDIALAAADARRAAELATTLKLPFALAHVHIKELAGNAEANARVHRYAALQHLAQQHGCQYILTAHQADDVLETLLMRIMRGAGPAGLAGIRPKRALTPSLTLIRPMLTLSRADASAICDAHNWRPAIDHTNLATGMNAPLRSQLRAHVVPTLKALAPGVLAAAANVTTTQREIAALLSQQAQLVLQQCEPIADSPHALRIELAKLRTLPKATLHASLRALATAVCQEGATLASADKLSRAATSRVIARVRSRSVHTVTLSLGPARATITRAHLIIARKDTL